MKTIDFKQVFKHPSIHTFNPYSKAVFANIHRCHTAQNGYHLYQCNHTLCNQSSYQYHCCGNRHCPYCGSMKRDQWIENRLQELLPTPYYHMVFTLPHELNALILGHRSELFTLLFESAAQTLLKHGYNDDYLGAEVGITMVLHTWGQDLSFHPHVHCIVSGGGFDGKNWIHAKRSNNRFLFPSRSLAMMYKAVFMQGIEKSTTLNWGVINKNNLLKSVKYKKWNVYAKAPFGGPAQVIEYLGRYTHKIAITQHRVLAVNDQRIQFKYKDYADHNKTKAMWLTHQEFLRRFELHILPKRFIKIRHYGYLSNKSKHHKLSLIRSSMGLSTHKDKVVLPTKIRMLEKYGKDISLCPCCKIGRLILLHNTRTQRTEKMRRLIIKAPS